RIDWQARTVNHVIQITAICEPKRICECALDSLRTGTVVSCRRSVIKITGPLGHLAEREVPQRVDLDSLSGTRRDDPVTDLGVHPGQLDTGFSSPEQTISGIDVY